MEITTRSEKETKDFAAELAGEVISSGGGRLIGLYGDLGSGKTTFAQGFAASLGVQGRILSPTYILMRQYPLTIEGDFKTLWHIDLYRLETPEQVRDLGITEILTEVENIVLIEWADRLDDHLPKEAMQVYLEEVDENTRKIRVER